MSYIETEHLLHKFRVNNVQDVTKLCEQLLEAHKLLERAIYYVDYEIDYYGAVSICDDIQAYLDKVHAPE